VNVPKTRGQAIAANCRECIHDPQAFGTWREQVAACPCTKCTLWTCRPIQDARSAPDWIKARDPDELPEGFPGLDQEGAVRTMRAYVAAKVSRRAVQAGQSEHRADLLPIPKEGAA
jgi:hypothetical protein